MLVNLTRDDIAAIKAARDAIKAASGGTACRVADAIAATCGRIDEQASRAATAPGGAEDALIRVTTEIHDWRISDNAAETDEEIDEIEDLKSDGHKRPWTLEALQASHRDALWLKATAPDGTERSLSIEIDQGNLTVLAFCNGDDALVKVYLSDNSAYVMEMRTYGRHPDIENEILEFGGGGPFRRRPGPPPPALLQGPSEEDA